jgi:hypothetical protein
MMKGFVLVTLLAGVVGCASAPELGDFALQYSRNSSRLVLSDELSSLPGDGTYLAIPGYIFVAGHMSLHPGRHRIAYACPGDWDWQDITHYVPSVEHTFEVGKWYELYCQDGYLRVRETVSQN